MREIKFRLMLNGRWHYWGFVDKYFAGLPTSSRESLTLDEIQERSQQYTGLKDMNGKEIYEGDIVLYLNKMCRVFDRLGCWFLEMKKELGYVEADQMEVIGNIYENPELMEQGE